MSQSAKQLDVNLINSVLTGCSADTPAIGDYSGRVANTAFVDDTVHACSEQAVAGSRSLCTNNNADLYPTYAIFQNTSGKTMICTVSLSTGTGGFIAAAYCDSASTPTTKVARCSQVGASGMNSSWRYSDSMTFVVPSGYYYGISVSWGNTGAPTIDCWSEWYLG